MLRPIPFLLALLWTPARAQQFDASGMQAPPDGANVRDPAFGFAGARTGAPVLSAHLDMSYDVLVQQVRQGPNAVDNDLVGQLAGANFSLQTGVYKKFGFGLSMPLWILSAAGDEVQGPAPGDITVWLPFEVIGKKYWAIGIVPLAGIPTGASNRYLGEAGFLGGGLISGQVQVGPMVLSGDGGVDWTQPSPVPEWPGGLHYRYAGALGVAPSDWVAFHGEVRGRAPLDSEAVTLPTEGHLTLKAKAWERGWLTFSGSRAITRGVGAPGLRLLIGLNVAPGQKEIEAEIVEAPPPKELHLTDARGFPISGAVVTAGSNVVESDIEGHAIFPPRSVKDGLLRVEHDNYETLELTVDPEQPFWSAEMERKPIPVAASVVGPQGALAFTEVDVTGPYDPGPAEIDEAGVHNWYLRPGTWTVRMASPGLGTQERTLVIAPDRTESIRVDAVLTPMISKNDNLVRVEVVDRLGRPVEDAVVALDSRDLGTTGTGGDLTVLGLEAGTSKLSVRSDRFGDGANIEVVVDETGEQTVRAVVDWRPGSVQVEAVDPFGKPVDATVSFVGPANLPARGTGSDGSEVFVVRPGLWNVEVSAPGLGTQIRTVEVTGAAGEVSVVDVNFAKDEGGDSNIELRIRDVEGVPVKNAVVKIDGVAYGSTSSTGDIELTNLQAGKRVVEIEGEGIEAQKMEVDLVAASDQATDVMVYYDDGVADVQAVDRNGDPVDAVIHWTGPGGEQDTTLGGDGYERLTLTPGEWQVEVAAQGYSTLRETVVVEPGTGKRADIDFLLVPEGQEADMVSFVRGRPRALEVEVLGPDGQPIDAKITLRAADGKAPVNPEVSVGGTADLEPPAGEYKMLVEAPGLRTQVVDVTVLEEGETKVAVELDERPEGSGAALIVKAETERGDAVVDAEILVDGKVVGQTDWTGTYELEDIPEEGADVEIRPDPMSGQLGVNLPVQIDKKDEREDAELRTTVVLEDQFKDVEITVLNAAGEEVKARVEAVKGASTGEAFMPDEQGNMALQPGNWTITAVTDDGERATAEVTIQPTDPRGAAAIGPDGQPLPPQTGPQKITLQVEEIGSDLADGALVPVSPILFDTAAHVLREDAKPLIADLARWLVNHRQASLVEVGGHTDDVGGVVYNQQLSERRAVSVAQALIENGVAPERLIARGYGLSRPITANLDAESRQKNRRVALVVLDWSE